MSGFSISILFYVAQIFGTITTENQNHKITEYRNNKGMLNAKVICLKQTKFLPKNQKSWNYEQRRGGAHKAPDLYSFDEENYNKALENGLTSW